MLITKDMFDLSFRFGFVFQTKDDAPIDTTPLEGWSEYLIKGHKLWAHPDTIVRKIKTSSGAALIVGDMFACQDGTVESCITKFIQTGDWAEFDKLTGRFVLIAKSHRGEWLLHDAMGSQSVYYDLYRGIAASHSALLATVADVEMDPESISFCALPEYTHKRTMYLPGDSTMYASIKALIPNNLLDLKSWKPVRYWPRGPMIDNGLENALSVVDDYFTNYTAYMNSKDYNLVCGITGGVDARAIAAALVNKGVRKLELVTWSQGLKAEERPIIDQIATQLGNWSHTYLSFKGYDLETGENIKEAGRISSGYSRPASSASSAMASIYPANSVFIRGYGGEVVRGFYNRYKFKRKDNNLDDFISLYHAYTKRPPEEWRRHVAKHTEGFMERANYDADFFNYEMREIFYWEQRMGVWGANMMNQMDPGMRSLVGLNSRPVFETCLALPQEYRIGTQIMLDITAMYDKSIAELPHA